ncbi:hypothetical protein FCV25MIE_03481 [Fagus crenata]
MSQSLQLNNRLYKLLQLKDERDWMKMIWNKAVTLPNNEDNSNTAAIMGFQQTANVMVTAAYRLEIKCIDCMLQFDDSDPFYYINEDSEEERLEVDPCSITLFEPSVLPPSDPPSLFEPFDPNCSPRSVFRRLERIFDIPPPEPQRGHSNSPQHENQRESYYSTYDPGSTSGHVPSPPLQHQSTPDEHERG